VWSWSNFHVEVKGVQAKSATLCEDATAYFPPRIPWSKTMVSVHTEVPMPVQLFTEAERARRHRFPDVIAYEDRVIFFTLSDRDLASIPRSSAPHNRLGYALQLCALRFMGFVPDDLSSAPPEAVAFVAQQLQVKPNGLADYGTRAQTRQDHLQAV
jgi:hypothetical protein